MWVTTWARDKGEAWGWDDRVGDLAGRGLPVHCVSTAGVEGPYGPAAASAAICDCRVPWPAGIHPRNRLDGSTA
jgi:hypothetical protein